MIQVSCRDSGDLELMEGQIQGGGKREAKEVMK
jgi:hypothetical protein